MTSGPGGVACAVVVWLFHPDDLSCFLMPPDSLSVEVVLYGVLFSLFEVLFLLSDRSLWAFSAWRPCLV
jgi:hypothetical protein